MRFYADGVSAKGIGYIPDWVRWHFVENGIEYLLTLDLGGDVDCCRDKFSCRIKGDTTPWELIDVTNDRVYDLTEKENEDLCNSFSNSRIKETLENAYGFVVGICPFDNENPLADEDTVSDCKGEINVYISEGDEAGEYIKQFDFEAECV